MSENELPFGKTLDTKQVYVEVYKEDGHNYGSFNDPAIDMTRPNGQRARVKEYLSRFGLGESAVVVEVGCGLGHLNDCHPNWKGFEYSTTAVEIAKRRYGNGLNIVEADARKLPQADDSVDFLYSFAALEHVPEVEKAFSEIERVMRPGGVAVVGPAWNCRPWTVKKLEQRPYSELGMVEKVGKFLIPLRNNLVFRMLCSMPSRLAREARLLTGSKQMELQYKVLEPDFTLWERYEHIADDDAFVSIDAHAGLAYFVSRGWVARSHPGAFARFSCRGEAIIVQKPPVA